MKAKDALDALEMAYNKARDYVAAILIRQPDHLLWNRVWGCKRAKLHPTPKRRAGRLVMSLPGQQAA